MGVQKQGKLYPVLRQNLKSRKPFTYMENNNKRGLSPVVATALLIAIIIILGIIVFLWFRNLKGETITKFGETNVELICEEVSFDASYSSGKIYISNTLKVSIYSFKIKVSKEGSYETYSIVDLVSGWPKSGLNEDGTFSSSINLDSDTTQITLIPVLVGNSENGEKAFVCDEKQGYVIDI